MKWSEVAQSCRTLCDPMDTRLLCPWDFLGKSTGVGCHCLLLRIFPTQGSNPGLPHCRQTLYHLSHQGSKKGSMLLTYLHIVHIHTHTHTHTHTGQLWRPLGWKLITPYVDPEGALEQKPYPRLQTCRRSHQVPPALPLPAPSPPPTSRHPATAE